MVRATYGSGFDAGNFGTSYSRAGASALGRRRTPGRPRRGALVRRTAARGEHAPTAQEGSRQGSGAIQKQESELAFLAVVGTLASACNDSDAGRAKNRRVEICVTP